MGESEEHDYSCTDRRSDLFELSIPLFCIWSLWGALGYTDLLDRDSQKHSGMALLMSLLSSSPGR